MRYGAKAKASPARKAQSWRREMVKARKYAKSPDSTKERRNAMLYASSGLPVTRITGVVKIVRPSRCSENAIVPAAG